MNSSIWKLPLILTDKQSVLMPYGARLLCVQVQRGVVCLWAIVDPDATLVYRRIDVYGTGFDAPPPTAVYIGTVQSEGQQFVWHVFDLGEESIPQDTE